MSLIPTLAMLAAFAEQNIQPTLIASEAGLAFARATNTPFQSWTSIQGPVEDGSDGQSWWRGSNGFLMHRMWIGEHDVRIRVIDQNGNPLVDAHTRLPSIRKAA